MPTPTPTTPERSSAATARPHTRESRTGARPTGSRCVDDCRKPTATHAHCTVCHRTFSAVTHFDAHRRDGWCLDPRDLGLTDSAGLWSTPEGHQRRAIDTARLAAHRATTEETTR